MSALKKILCVILITVLLMICASFIFDHGYRKFWKPFYDKTDEAFLGKTNYDVLFFGNSTVHFGINPYYVDSISKLSSYNFGIGGANITAMTALFRGYLENHAQPKIIFYSLDYSTLEKTDNSNYLLFFDYLQDKYAAEYLRQKNVHVGLVKLIPFLRWSYFDDYNRTNIITGFSTSPFVKNAIIYKGFINNTSDSAKKFNFSPVTRTNENRLEEANLHLLNGIINICKKKGIKLVFIVAPKIKDASDDDPENLRVDSFITKTSTVNGIPLIRFDGPTVFNYSEFHDKIHLNKLGATHYSIMIGNLVNEIMKNK